MRGIVLAVSCLLAAANCASAWERSDDAFLKECWGATPLENGAYQLHFEALVIAAVEGGILVRSGTCPDHRMGFARTDPIPDRQLDPIWDAAWGRSAEHTSELQSLMRISYAVFSLINTNANQTS